MIELHGVKPTVRLQIIDSIDKEKSGRMVIGRQMTEYIEDLLGLKHLFQYARKNKNKLGSSTVFDIGAGTTRGIHQASLSSYGEGLDFKATVLQYIPEIDYNLTRHRTVETPVETLQGVDTNSCAVIISDFGLGYSVDTESSIKSVDRVLVPGGVLKANFRKANDPSIQNFGETALFVKELKKLGYDIAIKPNDRIYAEVVIAIKPGKKLTTAKDLIEADSSDWKNQRKEIKQELEKNI